jgi:glutamate synthase domain-containing protein 3
VNHDYLATIPWRAEEEALFRDLLETHATKTGSRTATTLLEDWPATLAAYAPFVPVAVAKATRPQEQVL